jgi:Mrp family chromosome partitioning ATPase
MVAPGTPHDAAYRALAATAIATDRLPRAIVVTSPVGTIQDSVAANFAAALAELGVRVALVATDERQSWFLDSAVSSSAPSLTFPDLLDLAHRGHLNGEVPRALMRTRFDNLVVLAPGVADRDMTLDGFRPLLESLWRNDVDVVVVAGPALLEDPVATILAWTTRSVLWVFESGEINEAQARDAASRLELAGGVSFGVAMVDAKS